MSDYTPPALVSPTAGDVAGSGTIGGNLTVGGGQIKESGGTTILKFASNDVYFGSEGGTAFNVLSPQEGWMWKYLGVDTVGMGIPPIYGAGLLTSLGTTSATVASYTPTSSTGQSFEVKWRLSCVTASTPTLSLTYTDPKAGAQTITLYNSAMSASTVASGSYPLVATSAAAITVSGKDGTAADYIYATVEILQYQ